MERRQSNYEDERPPLPSVPPPPLSPSYTPPPTPATPSPHNSESPKPCRKDNIEIASLVEHSNDVCWRLIPEKPYDTQSDSRHYNLNSTLFTDPFLDILQSRNPIGGDKNEFNLDLDNFSRELMSVFEDLDAKIVAQRRAPDDVCLALLPKSLMPRELKSSGTQMTEKKIDSQNYVVTTTTSSPNTHHHHHHHHHHQGENVNNSHHLNKSNDLEKTSDISLEPSSVPPKSDFDEFSVKERAIPSPVKKVTNNKNPVSIEQDSHNNHNPFLTRFSSFSSHSGDLKMGSETIDNQSYSKIHKFQKQIENKNVYTDRNNINYMLYNNNNNHKSSDEDNENSIKRDVGDTSNQFSHPLKPQKNSFQNFCNRLKQRSTPNRNIYRQYVKQVIDKAPKLEGYDSDASTVSDFVDNCSSYSNNSFMETVSTPGSICSSPDFHKQLTFTDGVPVNIVGTVRKPGMRGSGNAFRNIRNIFNISGKKDDAPMDPSPYKTKDANPTPLQYETKDIPAIKHSLNNSFLTDKNNTEMSSFPVKSTFNDNNLRRKTSFKSLLNVFNTPEVHQTTWKSNVAKGKLESLSPVEPSKKDFMKNVEINGMIKNKMVSGGLGSLASSKRFVSCLEIRLGK